VVEELSARPMVALQQQQHILLYGTWSTVQHCQELDLGSTTESPRGPSIVKPTLEVDTRPPLCSSLLMSFTIEGQGVGFVTAAVAPG
jgi:hypothetical protein